MPEPSVPAWRLLTRLSVITVVTSGGAAVTAAAAAGGLVTGGPPRARRAGYRGMVRTLQALGPTFVKFGQISSTRRDAMPPELADAMAVLHDSVRPMSARRRARSLREAHVGALAQVSAEPVGCGSIACVYSGVLDDGRLVAVKLKRPGIESRMRADLKLLQAMMRFAERMPKMRGMPMSDLVGHISTAILGQLDFGREARNITRLRSCLADVPQIQVPEVYPELSTPDCLIFEYLPELDGTTPLTLPADVRADLADRVLQAANRMMFVEGFVHCDLHPGNVYLTADQHVVILDAGYCVQLPSRVRDLIAEFFACLLERDGRRCGEIVLESAVNRERADAERFIEGMIALVDQHGGGNAAFDMRVFGDAVFKLQQAHRIYAASDFAFPLISLNVLDGTVRGFSESVEFRQVGVRSGLSLLAFLLQQLHDLRDASLAGLRLLRAFDPPDVLTLIEA